MYYRLYEKLEGRHGKSFGYGIGRWNTYRTPIIYSANSISLTMVEHFSISGLKVSKTKFELAALELHYDIPLIEIKDLPKDWNQRNHKREIQEFGSLWAEAREYLCLKVPSSRIPISAYPNEHNLLINPLHPEFNYLVSIKNTEEVQFNLNKN